MVLCDDSLLLNCICLLVAVSSLPSSSSISLLLLSSFFHIAFSPRRQRSAVVLLLRERRTMWPFSACLVGPGPTQAIFPKVSLDCVFGFKPPETVMSVLLHLGAEIYVSGKAPFALKLYINKKHTVAWSLCIWCAVFLQSCNKTIRKEDKMLGGENMKITRWPLSSDICDRSLKVHWSSPVAKKFACVRWICQSCSVFCPTVFQQKRRN